jgi:plastocyanin
MVRTIKSQIFSTAAGLGSALFFLFSGAAWAATVTVHVGAMGTTGSQVKKDGYMDPVFVFYPAFVSIEQGDMVQWIWDDDTHSTTSGSPGSPSGFWNSGVLNDGATFTHVFADPGTFPYYCSVHGGCCGMTGTVYVAASTPTPTPAQPLNISTRMEVRTDAQVLIGGFIVTGNDPKKVILRAIGPSLAGFGIGNPLADPVLELHASDGSLITMNDNWKDTQQAEIEASGFQPQNDLESALISTLDPSNYTAVVIGKNGGTGVGLVEGYDLDQAADSQFGNISTRGFVETGTNVMIGGFILGGGGGGNASVVVRALGPSLWQFGVAGTLADPTLELRDENGVLVQSNDNWKETQQPEIETTGLQPTNDLESAVFETLAPGAYTAIVAGKGDLTGVGLVEVYRLP